MNKKYWYIPILIIAVNALAVILCWGGLPKELPAHFDLQGNAGGTMQRSVLLLYPLVGIVINLIAYAAGYFKHKLQAALMILTSGICLVLLSSTLVTLTAGQMPIFMLAEPVILLAAVFAAVICVLKSRK